MSLILEALRRSEKERHQDALPESLAIRQAFVRSQKKTTLPWPLIISALLAINLGLFGYFYVAGGLLPTEHAMDSSRQQSTQGEYSAVNDNSGAADDTSQHSAWVAEAPVGDVAEAGPTAGATDPLSLSAARKVLAEQPPKPRPLSRPGPEMPQVSSAKINEPELIASAETAAVSKANDAEENVADFTEQQQQQQTAARTPDTSIPHIDELDNTFKNSLPRLVFNSHIFSEQASGRRIMINDNYLREGEAFTGIKVLEITENGVVLEKLKRRFLVPVVRNWSPDN